MLGDMLSQEKPIINQNYLPHIAGKNAKLALSVLAVLIANKINFLGTDPDMNFYTLYYGINEFAGYRCAYEKLNLL